MLAAKTQIIDLTKAIAYHSNIVIEKQLELKQLLSTNTTPSFRGWKMNGIDCIMKFNRFCSTAEIIDCIAVKHPYLKDLSQRRKNISALGVAFKRMVDDSKIIRLRRDGLKGDLYGLPSWVDENGEPKEEYLDDVVKQLA